MVNTQQINIRLEESFLNKAKKFAKKNGFSNIQELVKETLREKLYGDSLSKEELSLVKKLIDVTNKKNLWGTEKELFDVLNE